MNLDISKRKITDEELEGRGLYSMKKNYGILLVVILLVNSTFAFADSKDLFKPDLMVSTYNSVLPRFFGSMLNGRSPAGVVSLTKLSYSDSSDGVRYSNYNGSITLTFKNFGGSKEAYFWTSLEDDNELGNIPCYAFIIAACTLDKTISVNDLQYGYEEAMNKNSNGLAYYGGGKGKVDAYYKCENRKWNQLTLSWFDWSE